MTPLALRLLRQHIGMPSGEIIPDRADIGNYLPEAHCFEVTEIADAARAICCGASFVADELLTSFLPAPVTWIEFKDQGRRFGFLLLEQNGHFKVERDSGDFLLFPIVAGSGEDDLEGVPQGPAYIGAGNVRPDTIEAWVLAVLAMINSPRVIGRRQHMPHRGLEKRLLAHRPNIGKFPLQAWTEILLHVTPPRDVSGDGVAEAHLTGSKALHFCRTHLRIRFGQVELVRAHWRGDPSLGVKRSRYKVAA